MKLQANRRYQELDTEFWTLQPDYQYNKRPQLVDGCFADVDFHFARSNVTDKHLKNFAELLGGTRRNKLQIGWVVRSIVLYDSPVTDEAMVAFKTAVPECSLIRRPEVR